MGQTMKAIICALLLTGCGTIKYVEVEVSVPCLGVEPKAPVYRYKVGAYPGDVEASKMVLADLVDAKQYAIELHAQHAGCK